MKIVLWDYITDASGYTYNDWTITVTNSAPYFNVPTLPNISVYLNHVGDYEVTQF